MRFQIEALKREAKSKLSGNPFRRDPYARRQPKFARGTPNPHKANMRAQAKVIFNAQRKIELALIASGSSWRELEKACNGKFRNAAAACRRLLNEDALKVLTAA